MTNEELITLAQQLQTELGKKALKCKQCQNAARLMRGVIGNLKTLD